ncbi:hypothetical protein KY360_02505 [Candidatus Woesearchaeota archaeon]|nr:hypothetical protein [Candidatus Woesearchaeota archaeon]
MVKKLAVKWWKFTLKAGDALIWWYKNSIITEESYSAKLMKKWPSPLKILMVIMWPLEWVLSGCFLIMSVFILGIWLFLPLLLLITIVNLFSITSIWEILELLKIWAFLLALGLWVWFVTKIPEKLKKFRKK